MQYEKKNDNLIDGYFHVTDRVEQSENFFHIIHSPN